MPKRTGPRKYIIVTGGVCSGLGKGIATASIGTILHNSGLKVFSMKLDPYLNVDPGTMNPTQHGEVFVTDDGAETDLDLGHYERFIDVSLSKLSSVSSGQIYQSVINQERRGDYLGGTIQIIPHVTNEIIKRVVKAGEKSKADVVTVEIGGTIGDIEGEPFLEAMRQLRQEKGEQNVLFVHLVLLPYLAASKELKTKPAQASVRELRRTGIEPDIIIARADHAIPQNVLNKLSLFCNVDPQEVIPAPTIKSIYQVPLEFEKYSMSKLLSKHLAMKPLKPNLSDWEKIAKTITSTKKKLKIGIVGKYVGLEDSYMSVMEALKAAGFHHKAKIDVTWIDAVKIEKQGTKVLDKMDGIIVPGGFGKRGVEGKIKAAEYARTKDKPYLGLCLGSQIMMIEFARNELGLKDANSNEFDENTPDPVVHIMEYQKKIRKKGGTMRLGAYPAQIKPRTKAMKAYGQDEISERHRHRYEMNNDYRTRMEQKGFIVSGVSPDNSLAEIVEVKGHTFMVGSQFHPELTSRPHRPNPLFRDFIGACVKKMAT